MNDLGDSLEPIVVGDELLIRIPLFLEVDCLNGCLRYIAPNWKDGDVYSSAVTFRELPDDLKEIVHNGMIKAFKKASKSPI